MPIEAKPLPRGYHSVNCYLQVHNVAGLVEFLKQAFRATEKERITDPDGRIRHAEVLIGDSVVMMGEASETWKARPATIYLYVDNVDAVFASAVGAGAKSLSEPKDQFYGDRSGGVEDLCGNYWWIATHLEDVSNEDLAKRMQAASAAR